MNPYPDDIMGFRNTGNPIKIVSCGPSIIITSEEDMRDMRGNCNCVKCKGEVKDIDDYYITANSTEFVKCRDNIYVKAENVIRLSVYKDTEGDYKLALRDTAGNAAIVEKFSKEDGALEFLEELLARF